MKPEKRLARRDRNAKLKLERADARRKEMIELGKTVIVTENEDGTKSYAFPPKQKPFSLNIPSLTHIAEKTRKTGIPRKNRPGLKPEHTAALIENASRSFATEVDKALGVPAVDGEPIPFVPMASPAEMGV
jgi:hypothetical protein